MKQSIQSPIKSYAIEHGLKVLQPEKFKNTEFIDELRNLNADLQVVVAFRMLPEADGACLQKVHLNLHGSLLPKYRGAAPINWAIMNGEKTTGVTTFFLNHEIDTGNILLKQELTIEDDDTAGTLHDKLMLVGAELVLKTVKGIEENTIVPQLQSGESCPAPKIFHETCKINWNQPVEKIYDFIRGLSPYPGAWTTFNGLQLKIYAADKHVTDKSEKAGEFEIANKKELKIFGENG